MCPLGYSTRGNCIIKVRNVKTLDQPINNQYSPPVDIGQLICTRNQLNGFCKMPTMVVKGIMSLMCSKTTIKIPE